MGKASDTLKSSDAAIVRLDSLISTGSSDLNSLDITDDLAPHLNDPQFDSLEEVCEVSIKRSLQIFLYAAIISGKVLWGKKFLRKHLIENWREKMIPM